MEEGEELDIETAGFVLTPLEIVAPSFGPAGVMTAIAVAALRGGVGLWASRRSQQRLREFLEQLRLNVEARLDEFEERLRGSEIAEDLAGRATRVAAAASVSSQARGAANVLAKGVLGDAKDEREAELLLAVIDGMTASEVDGILELAKTATSDDSGAGSSAVGVLSGGSSSASTVAEAVVARLVGRGLLLIDPPGFGGFGVTALGRQAVALLQSSEGTSG